jgi:hypothetical protein
LKVSTRLPEGAARPSSAGTGQAEPAVEAALQRHVKRLAASIGERNDHHPVELQLACDYVQEQFTRAGLRTSVDRYEIGNSLGNVIAEIDEPRRGRNILLICAAYDSPVGSPGAQQSATAVAAALELGRLLANGGHPRAVRFLVHAYGHQPMEDGSSGRRFSLRRMESRDDPIELELQLDTLGAWNGGYPQDLPFPWNTILPARSDYLLLCGGLDAREPLLDLANRLRSGGRVPVEGIAGPAFWPGIGFSDRVALLDQGAPIVVVGDTGHWRHAPAGGPLDEPESIDYAGMARAVIALAEAIGPRLEL